MISIGHNEGLYMGANGDRGVKVPPGFLALIIPQKLVEPLTGRGPGLEFG